MEKGSESERQLGLGDKIAFSLNLGFCGKKSHLETSSILEEFFFLMGAVHNSTIQVKKAPKLIV